MKDIVLDVTVDVEDYVDFNIYATNVYYKSNIMIWTARILAVILFIIPFYYSEYSILSYVAIVLLLFSFIYFPLLKKSVRKMYFGSKLMQQESILTVSSERLIEVTETNTSNYTWDKILQIGEDKKHIYIFTTKVQAYIINKEKIGQDNVEKFNSIIPNGFKRIK